MSPLAAAVGVICGALSVAAALQFVQPDSRTVHVDELNLQQQLTSDEWSALFTSPQDAQDGDWRVVRPREEIRLRRRRSTHYFSTRRRRRRRRVLLLDAESSPRLHVTPVSAKSLLALQDVVFAQRWANTTSLIPEDVIRRLKTDIDDCFFRGPKAALELCHGMRGVVSLDNGDLHVIEPLPVRFRLRQEDPFSGPHLLKRIKRNVHLGIRGSHLSSTLLENGLPPVPPLASVYVETAVFADRDLYRHMAANFPKDTERHLLRVVLAMVNAVQLLYQDPSLGRKVHFVLKRLEILREDPPGLARPHDIDRFLSSFCNWQRGENPQDDTDPAHWDHALILTGLDLYVVDKTGKVSSQVVGLAPVAGMCTSTSSCTVNEGRHFESVYVVAHEIGHNLGMRHDGALADNECDAHSYIMSPTLGSGKITWSQCSQRYLQAFLETSQARCLWDRPLGPGGTDHLDHSAEGAFPGERFNADNQCMLKFGRGAVHASDEQPLEDICRDLHCHRDGHTWTSHPALEGTTCGINKWCRSGRCVMQGLSALEAGFSPHSPVHGGWSDWAEFSDCASGCLYGESGLLSAGSSGLRVASRRCNKPRPERGGRACSGPDRRFRSCVSPLCANVRKTTVREFADQVCRRAAQLDNELLGTGTQRSASDPAEACTVWCYKRRGGTKSRGWTFPDGTSCQKSSSANSKTAYCIAGRCEEFVCDLSDTRTYTLGQEACPRPPGRLRARTAPQALALAPPLVPLPNSPSVLKMATLNTPRILPAPCRWSCISPGRGMRLLVADNNCTGCLLAARDTVQLCEPPNETVCSEVRSPSEYATAICDKFRKRVRRLSGLGMQLSAVTSDPDRVCRVACQDANVSHRFYIVNGLDGWLPYGTSCHPKKNAFCVSGKCLEFDDSGHPLPDLEFSPPDILRLRDTSN